MAEKHFYTIGLDFGSNSVRSLVIDIQNGRELGTSVFNYPSGDAGVLTDPKNPHVARQSPQDYLDGIAATVIPALKQARQDPDFAPERVIGIGVDTTGSTPIPVDAQMQPLATLPGFAGKLNACAWMWKDHSGMEEAERITALAAEHRPQYLAKCGGTYSSEWLFAKIWHCLQVDPAVFAAAHSWIEFTDFIPAVLAGITAPALVKCGICAAGHKAMYCDEWGGLPDAKFLSMLDPQIAALRPRLAQQAWTADQLAGRLCLEYAEKLGLPAGIAIAVGAFDAHLGAVGAGVSAGCMVKILGTSTCDILVAPNKVKLPDIPGVCGIVDGSALPGYYSIEAGQSAVGDIFNWFVKYVCQESDSYHGTLNAEALKLAPGASGLLALDWNNGNRTILVDARLSGLLLGCNLHTTRAEMYRALIEATAFGARRILDRIEEYGVKVDEVINCGGIAEKSPLFMQIYADVLGRPMKISGSAQTCALGSALMASVAAGTEAGGHPDCESAQAAICRSKDLVYRPLPANQQVYEQLYGLYRELHDSFGVPKCSFDHFQAMKQLLEISRQAKGH